MSWGPQAKQPAASQKSPSASSAEIPRSGEVLAEGAEQRLGVESQQDRAGLSEKLPAASRDSSGGSLARGGSEAVINGYRGENYNPSSGKSLGVGGDGKEGG